MFLEPFSLLIEGKLGESCYSQCRQGCETQSLKNLTSLSLDAYIILDNNVQMFAGILSVIMEPEIQHHHQITNLRSTHVVSVDGKFGERYTQN